MKRIRKVEFDFETNRSFVYFESGLFRVRKFKRSLTLPPPFKAKSKNTIVMVNGLWLRKDADYKCIGDNRVWFPNGLKRGTFVILKYTRIKKKRRFNVPR